MVEQKTEVTGGELLERVLQRLAEKIAQGVVEGLQASAHWQQLQQRLSKLEQQAETGGTGDTAAPKAAAPAKPPPGLGLPLESLAELLKQKAAASKPVVRNRRTMSRPTVHYRSDPRREERPQICSEPGCEEPARTRGLCVLHYQRQRYRERKITHKQVTASPLPPPPPPRRPVGGKGGTRAVFAMLYEEKGKKVLAGLVNQVKYGRSDLVERLNQMYRGMPGVPLEMEDVLRALHYHKLAGALHKREGEIIARHLRKQRGSLAKTAQKLKLELQQLKERITELGIDDEVTRIRNEFKEQILEKCQFRERLELALTKEKYLADLGIEKEVDESLRRELDLQLGQLDVADSDEDSRQSLCQALELNEDQYRRLARRYGLGEAAGA